ncbi:hypothetical protein DFH08DRAFT_688340 [Mycena albidolilacea]|uniref:Uncharacterized protein n=1 Tax=Mycena albidolilacea TaxID=1033008 RepID=A0AAD7AFV3_9AGAR|nr:hypothetical protein DFH08DRAFT_688340 [Mycena albidolilacea]
MLRRAHDEDHLRQLLDQRRAAMHTQMDAYDSPSLYSAPFFSPRPNDISDTHSYHAHPSPPAPLEARSRLNELAQSMLDLDDYSDHDSDDDDPDTVDAHHDKQDDSRMSLLGPKMRFHGKAPWEMDAEALEEEDEPEPDTRGRDGIRKSLANFRSSSRASSTRPSGESQRSNQPKPKLSFETKRSFETTASSSAGAVTPPPRQAGLRLNLPLSGTATPPRGPASPRSVTSSAPSPVPRSHHEYSLKPSLTRRGTNESAASQSLYSEEMHPYANPDLVVSYADDQLLTPAPRSAFNVARSDSTATVTESLTSRSVTLTPDTSTSSVVSSPRNRASTFHGKEISAPLPMNAPLSTNNISSPLVGPGLPPGWMERSQSPTFQLISLEQARAQRSRSTTAQNHSISSTSSTPFPEAADDDHSPPSSIASRARARSISTGARAKTALQSIVASIPAKPPLPERHNSEPAVLPGKALKHKKSGFMRLFNGGRAEKEGKYSPPPVPSLSDGYAAFNAQQQNGASSSKSSIHRIPPPQVSPSMFQAPNSWDDSGVSPISLRSTPPSLSIHTGPQSRLRAASTATDDFQTRTAPSDWHAQDLPQSAPPNVTEFPALKLRPVSTLFSAQFADHLSPSTLRDSDVPPHPGLDADVDTLSSTSPSTMVSPITPGLNLGGGGSARGSGDRDTSKVPMATITEDQSVLVQALQEQMVSAKKAWQRHIWELEGQVRDLKAEVDGLRAADGEYCDACGRGPAKERGGTHDHRAPTGGVVNRPRARTGTSARFGSAV